MRRSVIIGAVVGLLAGGGAGAWLGLSGAGGGASGSSAAADAARGCALASDLVQYIPIGEQAGLSNTPAIDQMFALSALMRSAGLADARYAPLQEHAEEFRLQLNRFSTVEADAALLALDAACTAEGL